ncbi:MAG: hypothetical protein ABJZ83_07920 [Yoonia sp.]|uniref:hypothetical protein n=1 Tax=Yoonia sp. TaxID=2212373 RepID=UPI003299FEB7
MHNGSVLDRRGFFKAAGVVSVASVGVLAVTPSMAAAAVDISHKIKISGDLRSFTQRMAVASAFVMLDVERDHFLGVLTEEFKEFEADIEALRNGDPEYQMAVEENPLVLEAINTVEIGWSILGPAIKDVIDAGMVDEAHFNKIEHVNVQVMTLTDSLIHRIMNEYEADIPTELAYQIDVVGMQRTLSQKMIKEGVLVALEFEAEAHHEMMVGSMQVFQFGMDKLRGQMLHNEIMLPEPDAEFAGLLAEVDTIWAELQPQLEALDASHDLGPVDILELSHEADKMFELFGALYARLILQAEAV